MKKVATWIMWITFVIAIIVWGIMGVKIFEGDSEFYTEVCIGTVCYLIIIICILIRAFGNKCPHCSKTIMDNGEFCSRCGMKIK